MVDIWQDSRDSNRGGMVVLNNRTLLLDTGCQDANWVTQGFVNQLRTEPSPLPCNKDFNAADGQIVTASMEIILNFKVRNTGKDYEANFFVIKNAPFGMILGDKDIAKNKFLLQGNQHFLVLAPPVLPKSMFLNLVVCLALAKRF
jgi:hypothetical protein